ncbi:hypothetical protein QFC20_006560 [Naganishia adeliensis]|uniref:Uncharacterized protein n=1 Tax=Naganishia adeliensis TaxID=92952 RepID=A0ACC2VAF7_9TREE|nr:hypothetical protein QFC20_006560 [Naganishia adeliensis]
MESGGLALPVEVLALVATYLAGSSPLRTLADLNESSRCLHQESQRILHATMTIEEVYTWDRCIKSDSLPTGTIANAHSGFNFAKVSCAFSRRRFPPGKANPHPSGDSEEARAAQSALEGTYLMAQKNHPGSESEVKRMTFAIRTAATSLDTYVKALQEMPSMWCNIDIAIEDPISYSDFVSSFIRFGEAFSARWSPLATAMLKGDFFTIHGFEVEGPTASEITTAADDTHATASTDLTPLTRADVPKASDRWSGLQESTERGEMPLGEQSEQSADSTRHTVLGGLRLGHVAQSHRGREYKDLGFSLQALCYVANPDFEVRDGFDWTYPCSHAYVDAE